MSQEIKYVNLETGRIVIDPETIQLPEQLSNFVMMNEEQYHEYCIEQRRKLDASKEEHANAELAFNEAEDIRINDLAQQISTSLGISVGDAKTMVARRVYEHAPDPTVSEKVFGGIVLPEEEG